ncbi:MAG: FG-GAP-like repeat-containing protein, partial [Planctomycetaceae bacterium]
TFTITTQPARGLATISGATLTYDPAADDFTTTPLTLVYTATVGTASDTGTITINIAGVNDPPVFVADPAITVFNDVVTTIAGSTLTANDLPGPANETDLLSIGTVIANSAQGGTVALNNQDIVYTPPADLSISGDTISYTVVDDQGLSVNATLDINLVSSSISQTHVLSTGTADGDVTIEVDSLGAFGSNVLTSREAGAIYDPIGAVPSSTTVFDSRVGLQSPTGVFEPLQAGNPNAAIQVPISGNLQTANSQFSIGPYTISLVQAVSPNVNSAGERLGAQLTQTYVITNTSGISQDLDLVRYLDADLLFDSSLDDGGGVLLDAAGNIVLFETDKGGVGSTDTTFVGITNSGGEVLSSNRFEIDEFSRLRTKLFSGSTASLADTIFNDSDTDGFVDAGSEYDVELALASRFSLAPGSAATFTTRTLFGTRPTSVAPPSSTTLTGQVSCDANGNGVLDPNEASSGVSVFIDENGNRRRDNSEVGTTTDSTGTYTFSGLNIAAGQTATVVVQNPPTCAPMAPDIGVTRSLLTTGALSRGIVAADINNDGHQELLVVNELGNDVSVLMNNGEGGGFSPGNAIPVGKRPVAITSWEPGGSSSPVIAVAAVGTSANRGSIYVIENGQLSRELSAGDGPVSVAINDFNGDGQADFVAATLRSGTIVGRMSGETEERVLAQARSPKSITAGLLNNDSFVDLVVVAYGYEGDESSDVIVLLGDGQGNFTPQPQQISGRGSVDVAVANFDGDSADEIVVASYDGSVRIFDLNGSVLTPIASVSTETGVESVAAEDVNGDGRVDLVIANSKAETIELFINQTSGFVRNRTISGVPSPSDLVVANLDGDDVLDIAVSNLYGTTRPNYRLPSSATVLGLTVTDREITFTSNQSVQDFTFRGTPLTPQVAAAWAARGFDVDYSGSVSARDALVVINSLSRQSRGEGEETSRKPRYKLDVNQDGQVTALDALLVINHLSRAQRQQIVSGDLLSAPAEGESLRRQQAVDALMSDVGELF